MILERLAILFCKNIQKSQKNYIFLINFCVSKNKPKPFIIKNTQRLVWKFENFVKNCMLKKILFYSLENV